MIPTFYIEDLTIEKVDKLIERGVVFDISSKVSDTEQRSDVDDFWRSQSPVGDNLCKSFNDW